MLTLLTLVFTLFLQPLGHEQEHDIPLLFVTECSTDTVSVLISWELCAYHCLLHRGTSLMRFEGCRETNSGYSSILCLFSRVTAINSSQGL